MLLKRNTVLGDNVLVALVSVALAIGVWGSFAMFEYSESLSKKVFAALLALVCGGFMGLMVYTLFQLVSQNRKWDAIEFGDGFVEFQKTGQTLVSCVLPESLTVIRAVPSGEIAVFLETSDGPYSFGISDFGDSGPKVADYLSELFPACFTDSDGVAKTIRDLPALAKKGDLEQIDFDVKIWAEQNAAHNTDSRLSCL